jgi:hypothetical protein
MKSFLLFVALLCAVILSSTSVSSVTSAANTANAAKKERAQMTFYRPVQLMGVTLQGEYLFVHDDVAMLRGESCTYVYKGIDEKPSKLVATFHCMPTSRDKVAYFTVRTALNSLGDLEIRDFQFAGSTEAHVVPSELHTAHVDIMSMN